MNTEAVSFGGRRTIALGLIIALLVTACRDSSTDTAAETPVPVATPTTEVVAEPTPTEVPTVVQLEFTDEQRIAAAVAAFDAEPRPVGLLAYDHLETTVDGTFIYVDVCAWSGESVVVRRCSI